MMADETVKAVLARYKRAKAERERWKGTLADAYRYALPGSDLFTENSASGAPVDPLIFDTTAKDALEEWAARLAYSIGLGFRQLVKLEPGQIIHDQAKEMPDQADFIDQVKEALEATRNVIDDFIRSSNFVVECLSALKSAGVSTGVLLVTQGDASSPVSFEAVPLDEVIFADGPFGTIERVYRESKMTVAEVRRLWEGATFPERDFKGDREVMLLEATEYDATAKDWKTRVICENHLCAEATFNEPRWIVFRVDKYAKRVHGVGPALVKLPDIKTLNRTVELTLQNASMAISGMWQAEDDGVVNPHNIAIEPGKIIPIAPGSRGLQALKPAGSFDVSQIILRDLRESIKRSIAGPALPGIEAGVRSATEYTIREQQTVILTAPHYMRLYQELIVPVYRAVTGILITMGLLGDLDLVGGTVRVVPASPYADMATRSEMATQLQGLAAAAQISAPDTQTVIDGEKAVEAILTAYGWPKAVLRSPAERQQVREMMQQQAQMAQQQQGGA
jgi:hypothetical protein